MKKLITNYRNLPAQHCGTGAMRNLLYHYCGLDLSEASVFGLGAGLESIFVKMEGLTPEVILFGRSISMEADATTALGIDYVEQPEMDNDKAWSDVKNEVIEGRPTMLTGDIFFLDYRDYKVRFPAHRFVLLGFEDEKKIAFVADRINHEPEICSYGALKKSRNPDTGISTFNLWGKFHGTEVKNSLETACINAITTCAKRMMGKDTSQMDLLKSVSPESAVIASGLDGLSKFAEDLRDWHEHEDRKFMASYLSQCIEKFGSGGGNFRKMYAIFLSRAKELVPDLIKDDFIKLAQKSAASWTELSVLLESVSREPDEKKIWDQVTEKAFEILSLETDLFNNLEINIT